MVESRIAAATGVVVRSTRGKERAKAIEAAMSEAVAKAAADGVTAPDEIRALMLAAGDKARDELDARPAETE